MPKYNRTLIACYFGYISQAIINNLLPLLFVTLQGQFGLSVTQIGFMVTFNFFMQLVVDLLAAKYADKIGYRACMVIAHAACAIGLAGLAIFPFILPKPYWGLLLSISIYAIGGGLTEVLVSPIVQALPLKRKESVISILHSFYCWGHAGVVLLTTLFFSLAGTQNWRIVCLLWAIVPAANIIMCLICPMCKLVEEEEQLPFRTLFTSKLFWIFVVMMLCAGAAEHSMVQWSSFFAEKGLQVNKAVGDLLGPCMFAILMGITRAVYGVFGDRFPLRKVLFLTSALCICSYLVAVFSPIPIISLIGCGFCGISVGLMWPGVFNLSATYCTKGGTAMFALLALAGDMGCSVGPSIVSSVAAAFQGELKFGLLAATIFPFLLAVGIFALRRAQRESNFT
jgi:MFS family permease